MHEILKDRSIIEIKGAEAAQYLQRLVTNDLLTSDNYYYAYMLNHHGRYLFDFFVYRLSDEQLFVDIAYSSSQNFINKLNFYKLRTKIEIKDVTDSYKIIYSKGRINFTSIYSKNDPRYQKLGLRSMILAQHQGNIMHVNNLYIADKYEYAIPDGTTDLIYEKSIIMEFGAKELNAISYTKGCYPGQEIVSRTEYLGVVRKKIFKVVTDIFTEYPSLENSSDIKINDAMGNNIGICCSGFKNTAIGLIKMQDSLLSEETYFTLDNSVKIKLEIPQWRTG